MFDPNRFRASEKTYILGNSAHPISRYVTSLILKKVPEKIMSNVYYARSVNDNFVVTYRPADHTVAVWVGTFKDFQKAMEADEINYDVLHVPLADKYIGNTVMTDLITLGLV